MKNQPINNNGKSIPGKAPEANNYIIPPGLFWPLKYFEAHFKVSGNQPILIVGPTGVGKSVFSHIYWKLCGSKQEVISENCAYFGDKNSDPLIARAELFGYKKGSHRSADKDKDGLIKKADGGVLFLDEIGMLPKSVQGQLYRFMETGEYRPLGAIESINANVRVVGATNEEGDLLEPFRFRFSPLYIPPLYERRQDILYYINAKFPKLIPTLTSEEIMILLAYNWPGNVREVNHVANLLLINDKVLDDVAFKLEEWSDGKVIEKYGFHFRRFHFEDERYANFYMCNPRKIMRWAASWGGDEFLRSQMARLGFYPESDCHFPFEVSDKDDDANRDSFTSIPDIDDDTRALSELLGVKILPKIDAFDRAYRCYSIFCGLLGKWQYENANILADIKNGSIEDFNWHNSSFDTVQSCKSEGSTRFPKEMYEYLSLFEKLKNPEKRQDDTIEHKYIDISNMKQEELLKVYNKYLLTKTGNNKRKAAGLAGVKYNTFLSQLKKRKLLRSSKQKN
jgi:transcriptional regulator with AAA-type ATPase domain